MAQHSHTGSEEDVGDLFSDCFWEIKGFKQVVKRIDDGATLTDNLMQLIHERSELELKYAKGLKTWSRKWEDAISKGPEYGSLEQTMKSLTVEANETADIHLDIRQKLTGSSLESIKHWKNSNYQKTFVKWKQTAAAQEGFDKVQRPWAKRFLKVEKAKKAYHLAARTLEQLKGQLDIYERDAMTTTDALKKLKDKLSKAETENDKTKDKYRDRLNELDMANQQYINEMTVEFEKCQAMEKIRIEFFVETIRDYLNYIDVSKDARLTNSFQNIQHGLNEMAVEEDLKRYADQKGTGMQMNWPKFMEYDEVSNTLPIGNLQMRDNNSNSGYDDRVDNRSNKGGASAAGNPFNGFDDDSEWGDQNTYTAMPTSVSEVRVMAMFDYTGAEADELSFREGDVLIQLDEEDENGWCRGLLNGVEGLYPGSYVQLMK
ncbi:hypothetical protein ACHWQZ_G015364 [Mnemiopsis leidyi]